MSQCRRVLRTSLAVRGFSILALVVCAQLQQAFDTSHTLLSYSLGHNSALLNLLMAFVRWDTVYFVSIASPGGGGVVQQGGGYQLEQSLAFQPGIVYLLRWSGYVTPSLDGQWSPVSSILLTTILANLATLFSPTLLYKLTRQLTHNDELAYTAALLSIFAPAAGTTLTCPTPEPFYSFAALAGLLALERRSSSLSMVKAALWFGLATLFRTNGVLLVGFLAWHLRSFAARRAFVAVVALVVLALGVVAPFVLFQSWGYARLCQDTTTLWCRSLLPSVYSHVQSTYWNVGLFRYWQLAQLPNFALAMPVLFLIGHGVWVYFSHSTVAQIAQALQPLPSPTMRSAKARLTVQSAPLLLPYVVHSAGVGMLLLMASHVQIALRFASPGGLPLVWWTAAHLAHRTGTPRRRTLVTYLTLQYVASIVLYAGFYPPA